MNVQQIAKICHDANKSLCESQGDFSQKSWDDAFNFKLKNPDTTPEGQHIAWCKDKYSDGWSWGPYKKPEIKEHPCLIDYEKLPAEQQAKDHLFAGIVTSLKPFLTEHQSTHN